MNEFLNILRYRKTPGLVSAIDSLHNLVYADCQIIRQRGNQNYMDACLEMLAGAAGRKKQNRINLHRPEPAHPDKAFFPLYFYIPADLQTDPANASIETIV